MREIQCVPDLIVHSKWLLDRFPDAIDLQTAVRTARNLHWNDGDGHYLIVDMKFTTGLTSTEKVRDLKSYGSQVRIYSYMLGQLQGLMPQKAYIVQRQPVDALLPIEVRAMVDGPLDVDLRSIRDWHVDLKINGAALKPWTIPDLHPNLQNTSDDPWHSAKVKIAQDYVPGSDPCLLYQIGRTQKVDLQRIGHSSLDDLLSVDADTIDLERCSGLGAAKCPRIRAILTANSTGTLVPARPARIPPRKACEFFLDFEAFNNLNVDFDRQWPTLEGCEMIFLIGAGYVDETDGWGYECFVAESETHPAEARMIDDFVSFLNSRTSSMAATDSNIILYHWSGAEVWQLRRAANRHNKPPTHVWRNLPWFDLQKEVFHAEPIGVPGAWGFGLKEIVGALNEYDKEFRLAWPGNLDDGLTASVMGWSAYERPDSLSSAEMKTVIEYNEVDCKAVWKILEWLRSLA